MQIYYSFVLPLCFLLDSSRELAIPEDNLLLILLKKVQRGLLGARQWWIHAASGPRHIQILLAVILCPRLAARVLPEPELLPRGEAVILRAGRGVVVVERHVHLVLGQLDLQRGDCLGRLGGLWSPRFGC